MNFLWKRSYIPLPQLIMGARCMPSINKIIFTILILILMFSLSSCTSSCVYWGQSYLVTLVTPQNCKKKCLQILLLLYICIKPNKARKQEKKKRNSNFCYKKQLYLFLSKVSATFSEIAGNLWKALNCTRAQFVPAILLFRHRIFPRYVVLLVTPPCAYSFLIVDSFFYVNIYHIWSQTNTCPETPRNYRIFRRLLVITRSRDGLTGLFSPLLLARIITLFCLYETKLKTSLHKLFWFTSVICIVWTSVNSLRRSSKIGRASCGKECRSRWSPYH